MNKKLALKISKHPLIKKLMEDRTISKNVIANLIVEEIIQEDYTANLADLNNKIKSINNEEIKTLFNQYIDISKRNEIPNKQGIISNLLFMANQNKIKALTNKLKYIIGQFSKDKEQPQQEINAKELVDNIATVIINNGKKEQFISTYNQNEPAAVDFVINKLPEETVNVLRTAEEKTQEKVVQAVADKLKTDEKPESTNEPASTADLKPLLDKFVNWLNTKQKDNLSEDFRKVIRALGPKNTKLFGTDLGKIFNREELKALRDYFQDPENGKSFFKQYYSEQPKYLEKFQQLLSSDSQPSQEETAPDEAGENENPEEFDVDTEALQTLVNVSEKFIEKFYEQTLLKDQGILLKAVLDQLSKIIEKEEQEKAAQRRPQEQPQDEEEPIQEEQDSNALRNIKVGLKSFIKVVKDSKEILKIFKQAGEEGKSISSSLKQKFIEKIEQIQDNIKELVKNISKLNVVQEQQNVPNKYDKWAAIEDGYDKATPPLRNIISYGSSKAEDFDMQNNVKDAYEALISISHFFPSVNPFGKKTSQDMGSYYEQYEQAIKNVKDVLRDVLELAQGEGSSNTVKNAVVALKRFSGEIQNIFGVNSSFQDVQVQPNEPAAEDDQDAQPEQDDQDDITGFQELTPAMKELYDMVEGEVEDTEELDLEGEEETEFVSRVFKAIIDEKGLDDTQISKMEEEELTDLVIKYVETYADTIIRKAPHERAEEERLIDIMREKVQKLSEKTPDAYFSEYYKPTEKEIPYKDVSQMMNNVFYIYKNNLGEKTEPRAVSENITNVFRKLNSDEDQALRFALEEIEEKFGTSAVQRLQGFLGQTSVEALKTDKKRKENNAWLVFTQILMAISENLIEPTAPLTIKWESDFKKPLKKAQIQALKNFRKYLNKYRISSKLDEELKMTKKQLEQYEIYLKKLKSRNEKEFKNLQTALRTIGSSKLASQNKFKKWLGFKKITASGTEQNSKEEKYWTYDGNEQKQRTKKEILKFISDDPSRNLEIWYNDGYNDIKKHPNFEEEFDDGPPDIDLGVVGSKTVQEQIANKLKSLVREMLNKGK
jgi:hypothetical protein